MGALLSYFWGQSPNLDVVDPATGLTLREKKLVVDSWGVFRKDVRGSAVQLFIFFFTNHPEYKKHFKDFSDVKAEDLASNKFLVRHALTVVYSLTSVVDSLGEPEVLVALLQKIGANHKRFNIPDVSFTHLRETITGDLLKWKFGSSLSEDVVSAWDKTLKVAVTVILESLHKTDI